MSQWGQPGFQYPMQTGFPGAQHQQQFQPGQQLNPTSSFQQSQGGFGVQPGALGLGAGLGGVPPQPTGFPGARLQGLQQIQQTGFPAPQGVGTGFLQTQPTGFPGAHSSFQQHPPPPPIPPLPTSYQQKVHPPPPQQQSAFLNANQSRLGGPSASSFGAPSLVAQSTGVGLLSQPTGFAGRAPAPLVPQVTGFVDPRLQMMSSSFMPANVSAPYTSGGAPQLAPPPQQQLGLSLQQSFQQHNQAHGRGTAPKLPWALSKAEKKQYDQIFRAWDAQGTGFISGQAALEVFGQSGLDRNDLARIWTLADTDNRGKLNLAEFHVAMGLIYRRLNGNDVPDELPPELVPPSSRDLDTSVNFLKDILKNDSRARSPSGLDVPVSRLKERSFTSSSSLIQQGGRQDATVYKHEDVEPPGGFYQPRNRHVDRSTVRSRAEDANPATSDLSSIKRQLLNTQKMLDDTLTNERSSDTLDRELEDLRYRITRLQEDLEYVSKGSRTTAKEEERRRLERELVRLMHEEVPELEKKVEEREARRESEKREWARDRDRRNDRSGRFGGEDGYSSASRYREEEERPYSRSAPRYDRDDRDYDRDRSYRDGGRERDRDVDNERDRGASTATRSPPPPPTSSASQPRPPSAPARSPAPSMKNMTPEERQAFIRAEAQRRLEARKQALGVVAPPSASPTLDTTIEDRLAQEKKEAEEKAREAERQAEEREKQRKEKLEAEKALKGGITSSPTPTTTAPPPAPASAPVPTPVVKIAPPPPKPRAPARPPPRKGAVSRTPAAPTPSRAPAPSVPAPPPVRSVPSPAPPPAPVVPDEGHEDAALKAREEALRKRREEHAALLRKLEEEEEEARKAEAAYQERRNQFLGAKGSPAVTTNPVASSLSVPPPPAPPTPSVSVRAQVSEPAEEAAPPPPPPPPPPPSVQLASFPATDKPSNNPFSRLMKEGGGSAPPPTATANGSSNPFFRSQTAPPAAPPPPKSPGIPPPVKTTYHTAPKDSDDDWDDVMEKEEDASSDEELGTRDTRMGLAQQLFGNLLPSRPQSAGPAPSSGSPISPAAPPPPPPAPSAPPGATAPSVPIASPAPTGGRGALLSAIQGGARLRKIVTNDRSGAATSGKIVGDNDPPAHINAAARPPSPPAVPLSTSSTTSPLSAEPPASLMGQSASFRHEKKESIDWYNALAADVDKRGVDRLPVTAEEYEEEEASVSAVPAIQISDHAPDHGSELMADVDLSSEIRVRSLYPYVGQRAEDLDFDANMVIVAHPSKSGGDWWYGTAIKNGNVGFFPQTYVQKVDQVHATALYAYEGTNEDELVFNDGDTLIIVDRSETDWWKAERNGLVFIVPAAYLELIEDFALGVSGQARSGLEQQKGQGLQADHAGFDGEGDRHERVTDIYSTPYTSPQDTRRPELHRTLSMNGDEDDEEDAYYSLDEEGTSESAQEHDPQDERETVAREIERRQVLEAAGLVVSPLVEEEDKGVCPPAHAQSGTVVEAHECVHVPSAPPLSAVTRSKSASGSASLGGLSEALRRRRPVPAVPQRGLAHIWTKNLPPIPTIDLQWTDTSSDTPFRSFDTTADKDSDAGQDLGEVEKGTGHFKTMSDGCIIHPDDAFERYETFKKMQASHGHGRGHSPLAHGPPTSASASRMSMSSFDTGSLAPTSPPRSPAASVTPSLREREREGGSAGAGGESRASQFLSFLGRHTHTRASTPDNAERDRKLVISGPILHAPTPSLTSVSPLVSGEIGGPTRDGSPVFGSSWASLVDRSALEGIPKEERKRQEAIFELISTEADYVRDVQLIVKLFYCRLIEVLDEKATEIIFSNIEDILLTNTTFLSVLEERQRDCRLYIDHIGDLLEKHMQNMGVYLNYCVNQANTGKTLQQMREANPALALQLQNLREDLSARNLDLSSYLLVPMQRLTRYPLLIRQIMHYTPDAAPSVLVSGAVGPPSSSSPTCGDIAEKQSIFAALQTAERILEDVNETIRDQEGRKRLEEVSRTLWIGQGRLDLTAPTRHLGPRKLLKESVLSKARSGRKLQVLLCSDILVLVDEAEKGLYRVPIPVHEVQVKPSRSGREDPLIRLHVAYPRGGDTIVLRASNIREAKAWGDAILHVSKKALEGIRNVVREPGEM